MEPLLLTYEQVGQRLQVSARTVRRRVAEGSLPAVGVGSARRVRATDVDAFVKEL